MNRNVKVVDVIKIVCVRAVLFTMKEDRWPMVCKGFQEITRFYYFTSHVGKEYPA